MNDGSTARRLPPEALRWRCDPGQFEFETTSDLEPISGLVGQDRAVDALRFGLKIRAHGQHVFVRGLSGTGRSTLVRQLVDEIRPSCPLAPDRCYVYNFDRPERPRLIDLPREKGRAFQRRIDRLVDYIEHDLLSGLASEDVKMRQSLLDQQTQRAIEEVTRPFEDALREAELALMTVPAGNAPRLILVPLIEGRPASEEDLRNLVAQGKVSDNQLEEFDRRIGSFSRKLDGISDSVQEIQRRHRDALERLIGESIRGLLSGLVSEIARDFPGDEIAQFLNGLLEDVARRDPRGLNEESPFTRLYRVNVILGHVSSEGYPVVVENTPTVRNLLGGIEGSWDSMEDRLASHLMIRGGSLLQADGGFLILEARDVLAEPGAWRALVRTLRTRRLEIVPMDESGGQSGPTLYPEPIPIDVKVVLVGDEMLYFELEALDPDFSNLFKVLVDFDVELPRDDVGIRHYASVLHRITEDEGLLPFDRGAVAAMVEQGARIAELSDRLTARFGRLADIAREASFLASEASATCVTADDVRQTVTRIHLRSDLPARYFRRRVADATIRIETRGSAIGQINGMAVIQAGSIIYGFPTRITATIGPGQAGAINIEREAELSGAIHTKGFYILGGLLRHLLRTDHPLAFDASIAFEQSYGGIDGDSASAAEVCCLLSSLTDVPLRQDLAMTGAIDQRGNLLPVGAVNEKVEGFFDVCQDLGLSGTQGVVLPEVNVGSLMLRDDVVEACARGRFHVHSAATVLDALALFTGWEVGSRKNDRDPYPEGSLLALAVANAKIYWERTRQRVDGQA